jgi:hypothetical protein
VIMLTILASNQNSHSHRPLRKHPGNLSVEALVPVQTRMRLVATRGDVRWWTCKSRRVLPDKRTPVLASLWSRTVLVESRGLEQDCRDGLSFLRDIIERWLYGTGTDMLDGWLMVDD